MKFLKIKIRTKNNFDNNLKKIFSVGGGLNIGGGGSAPRSWMVLVAKGEMKWDVLYSVN